MSITVHVLSVQYVYQMNVTVRHSYRTGLPCIKRHNVVNIRFTGMKISGIIAEGMLSLQI